MRKRLKILLPITLLLALSALGFLGYLASVGKQVAEQQASIAGTTDSTYGFTYLNRNDSFEAFTFVVPTERDVQVRTWTRNLFGHVSASIASPDGTVVFDEVLESINKAYQVHLEAGEYEVTVHFSNAFAGGSVVGVDYSRYYMEHLPVLSDTDRDGLPDAIEEELGTDPKLPDTDADSLGDYAEAIKYGTNPLEADSDGDGTPDGDWGERREYAYTVYVSMLLRQPFDLDMMSDIYQDVRVVAGPDEAGYTQIEAVIYPETHVILSASAYPLAGLSPNLEAYTRPGIATNYDASMQAEVLDIVAGAETDVQVTDRVLKWVRSETDLYLDYSIPEVYFTYLEDGRVQVRNYTDSLPADELLRTHYFAASMFRERVHGTCTSIATLKCAMLKAAGIPCRLIQTLFPIYYHGSQTMPYTNNLDQEWDNSLEQPPGEDLTFANHALLEVYLGGQWVRVDENIGIYTDISGHLSLKILAVADWSEVDFSETYPVDWINDRPYYTLLIEDQEPRY
jgi:transglutaminase-like putative cysteine protease